MGGDTLFSSATGGMAKNHSVCGIFRGNSQVRAWHLAASGDLENSCT